MPSENPDTFFSVQGLYKSFSSYQILKDVSFKVAKGSCVLLLGANGAGKSTLLKICAGLIRPESGQVIFPEDQSKSRSIGYSGHQLMLYSNLTVEEHLNLMMSAASQEYSKSELLENWNLSEYKKKRINQLSRGLQFRVSLALTLFNNPKFIFLDEPSSSFDDNTIELMHSRIQSSISNGFAIIATHDIDRSIKIADRVMVIKDSKIAYDSEEAAKGGKTSNAIEDGINFYRTYNR